MRVVVALLVLAGCDDLWNLELVPSPDAGGMQDSGFDLEVDCPPTYELRLFPGSRYRVTDNSYAAWDTADDCADDTLGRTTHLATAQTAQELAALHESLVAQSAGRWWLGAVQPKSGVTLPLDGWIWLTGEPIEMTMWSITPLEPNDGDGLEPDHLEQFALIQDSRQGLIDLDGGFGNRGLCECDGLALSIAARSALAESRP
jgi:hypothetical protein